MHGFSSKKIFWMQEAGSLSLLVKSFGVTESITFFVSVELADDFDTEDIWFLGLANIGELPKLYNILHQSLHDSDNLGLLVI